MRLRSIASIAPVGGTTVALIVFASSVVAGQGSSSAGRKPSSLREAYKAQRTPDGQPDLQGVWSNNSITPLERPPEFGEKTILSDKDVSQLKKRAQDLLDSSQAGEIIGDSLIRKALADPNYNNGFDKDTGDYNSFWITDRDWSDRRTSLIIDPPNGRLPPATPEAQQRRQAAAAYRREHGFDGPEDLDLGHRCLAFGSPRLAAGYNSYYQIVQDRDYVAFVSEMAHDARIIPLDGRPHLPQDVRQWLGDSRGHWDGNTLVVETTNYRAKGNFMGSTGNLKIVERFTRVAPDRLKYEVTADDSQTWAKPWTAVLLLRKTTENLYEYACHEGNESVMGALSGERARERAAQGTAQKESK
jgi:hypothetical protein